MIGKIAVSAANFAIDKPYSYWIPQEMTLIPGQRVTVPFGRGNRRAEGVVLSVEEGSQEGLKTVEAVLDEQPLLSPLQLRLAAFLRERYFCTFFDACRAILPAGLWFDTKAVYSLTENREWKEKTIRKPGAAEILRLMEQLGGGAKEQELEALGLERDALEDALRYLAGKKWISTQTEYLRRGRDKTEKIATLTASAEEARDYAQRSPRQRAVLEMLSNLGEVSVKELCYFTGATPAMVRRLEEKGYVTLADRPVLRCREIVPAPLDGPLVLNEEQESCFRGLRDRMEGENPGVALLYGITGSGKTSVYIRLIRECLDQGKSALLLVPEIALTPQLLGLMAAHFGDQVAVLHSSLPAGERYDQWKRIRSGEAKLVVGTRSAVFAPCTPGLIILDEEQEHSYKSENTPRYHAREVAIWRGAKEGALVLLGSATPSIETMYRAKTGVYGLYTLHRRYNGRPLPRVEIVDMRRELELGNDGSLSIPLRQAMVDTHEAGKQTILLLNRRGASRALVCVDCRETPECPRCSLRLTYHSANDRLMCHYCGFSEPAPRRCPKCGGPLKPIGTGTQKVQQELAELFPQMETLRMDADTVSAVNTHEKILERFQQEHIPVLLGTQMVAKGLNLPQVTLVGVLDADLSLYTGGYRAGETTFNMLTQVVGRAGRGDTPGRAVIQTLVPEHQVIRLAAEQDYEGFYNLEIQLRRVQNAPPFGDYAIVTFLGQDEKKVIAAAAKFRDSLRLTLERPDYAGERCGVLGPAPCPVPKINYNYRYQLTLRCAMTKKLRALLAWLLGKLAGDKEFRGVSAFVDVNGYDG
ncbi:MAG: primosomal protein N' [Faecousia sp.]